MKIRVLIFTLSMSQSIICFRLFLNQQGMFKKSCKSNTSGYIFFNFSKMIYLWIETNSWNLIRERIVLGKCYEPEKRAE